MAVSVFAQVSPAATPEIENLPENPVEQDYRGIAMTYLKTWAVADDVRAQVFARRYDSAGQRNGVVGLLGYAKQKPPRLADAYVGKLRAAFAGPDDRNPFSGMLDRQQLIRLQK